MTEDKRDNGSLPDLPDLPDLPEMEELPELQELPELDELPEIEELEPIPVTPKPVQVKPEPVSLKPEPLKAAPKTVAQPKKVAPKTAPKSVVASKSEPKPEPKVEMPAAAAVAAITPLGSEAASAVLESLGESAASDASAAEPNANALKPGEKPPLRKLEKAVVHLRLAALIVAAGALLPFMLATKAPEGGYASGSLWFSFLAKLVGCLGAWVLYKQIEHNWGPKLPGLMGKLASVSVIPKPKEEDKPKRRSTRNPEVATLDHPFPTPLHLIGAAIIIGAFVLAIEDPRTGKAGPVGLVEYAMFIWAVLTYVHIAGYERWGKFNPLYAMLFLGMLLVGVSSVFSASNYPGALMISAIIGGLAVGGGGGLAAFTIVEAMMQAKKEGDAKKAAAIEARKAARASSRKK